MTKNLGPSLALCVALLAMAPNSSLAQTPANSFDDLRLLVRDGNVVDVRTADGRRARGKVLEVNSSTLEIASSRLWPWQRPRPMTFMDTAVTSVSYIDSTREGAAIGFAAGFVPIMVAACATDDCWLGALLGGPVFGVFGMGIGATIDRLHNRTVYVMPSRALHRTTLSVAPMLTARSRGAALRVGF